MPTASIPKEMLPILDKPLIQFVVDEAISAIITRLVFITSYTKRAIEDYFDSNYELESRLEGSGKLDVLKQCSQSFLVILTVFTLGSLNHKA